MGLIRHGREVGLGVERYLPLTQLHGGGPTQASICENGEYWGGKLYVRDDGVVVFMEDSAAKIMFDNIDNLSIRGERRSDMPGP